MAGERHNLKPFLGLFVRHWKAMGLAALLALVTVCAGVGLLGLAGWFIAAAAFAGLATATAQLFNLFLPSVGVRLLAMVRTAGRYAERVVSHETTFRMLQSLRLWFYRRIEPLAPARLLEFRSGDILNRIVADIDALDNLFLRVVSPTVVAVVVSGAVFAFAWKFHFAIAAIVWLTVFAGGFVVAAAALKAGADPGARLNRQSAFLRVAILEGLQGMAELMVFGAHRKHLARIARNDGELIRLQLRMSRIKATGAALITLLTGAAVLATLIVGIQLIHAGRLDGTQLTLLVMVTLAAVEAVMPLPGAYQFLGHTREAARRLQEMVAIEPPTVFTATSLAAPAHFDIRFEDLTFSYGKGMAAALENFDLSIEEHERVAIVGQTGAGKSTLASLLLRFWDPQSGGVRIGGVDVRKFSETDLRRYVVAISQQAHMFNASLRDNLLLADSRAGDDRLQDALQAVALGDFVRRLPDGLDTWIGESGSRLSTGQARRVALARAIIKDAPIWVLDEPTEGLDRVTDRTVMQTILELTRGRTLLMMTHRLAALERMDRIVVMESGRILEQGSHRELTARPSRYAELVGKIDNQQSVAGDR